MSAHAEAQPTWTAPPLACDAHFHVFGTQSRYPVLPETRYEPPSAPLADYLALSAHLGIARYVFVQPSAYGRDNSCMLDAMREVGPTRCRGIVDIDEDVPDAELERLNALGVRGVRINVSPVHPPEAGLAGSITPRIERLAARCAEIGWHLDFLGPGWLNQALLPVMRRLPVDYSIAHMGTFPASQGVQQPGFQALLDHVRQAEGRCWVKLTGVYRVSQVPGFVDAAPLARALVEAAPDQLIWGSDYPHLSFADAVGSVELFNLLAEWVPDVATRHKIMVDNPARLFGF
ncbi:MAG: amidohydrolase family protein [Chloroflexi bacterium]|nr:amidohydrolase family protein [Chloroflexota bacterium]MDA1239755.1 amidohydrolase family protein [Chloroflexota bacterium]MQC47674.1 GntR family transcriptional regulator [Chloroflexota bacterium]